MFGCSMMSLDKDYITNDTHQVVSEQTCSDPIYRECTSSGTYSQCLSELGVYQSICVTKSFSEVSLTVTTSSEREEAAEASANYAKCMIGMHAIDSKVVDKGGECPVLVKQVRGWGYKL